MGPLLSHFDHFYGYKYGFEGMYEFHWTRRMSWNDKKNFLNFLPKNSQNSFFYCRFELLGFCNRTEIAFSNHSASAECEENSAASHHIALFLWILVHCVKIKGVPEEKRGQMPTLLLQNHNFGSTLSFTARDFRRR